MGIVAMHKIMTSLVKGPLQRKRGLELRGKAAHAMHPYPGPSCILRQGRTRDRGKFRVVPSGQQALDEQQRLILPAAPLSAQVDV
jgi:hypothetical protein